MEKRTPLIYGGASAYDRRREKKGEGRMRHLLEPGALVRHPGRPEWGLGQVQSVTGDRAVVNFEQAGKQALDLRRVSLEFVESDE